MTATRARQHPTPFRGDAGDDTKSPWEGGVAPALFGRTRPAARRAALIAATIIAAPLLTASTCTSSPTAACDIQFGGLEIRHGRLVETIAAVCDEPPQRHLLRAGLEQRVGETWIERGRGRVVDAIPDTAGLPIDVGAPCEEGNWRSWVRVEGVGPLPSSLPFSFSDTGDERAVALVECAG